MSDTFDPYGEDDATMELIYQMLSGGWQPYQQQMNVPYQKQVMDSSTDPTRAFKSQDTILKSQKSLMGFSPIEEFAGPQPELWIPGTEQLEEEIAGDDVGQQLLDRLNQGEGVVALQRMIAEQTYDPENELDETGLPPKDKMSPQQAEVYQDWLKRYSKARSEDYIKLGQPGTVTDPGELDVMGDMPTDEALNPNYENEIIQKLRVGGAFGEERKQPGSVGNRPEALRRDFASSPAPQQMVRRMVQGVTNPSAARRNSQSQQARTGTNRNRYTDIMNRGYDQLEQKYRGDVRKAQSTASRPSLAKERAFRAIVAYRMAHGMNPT